MDDHPKQIDLGSFERLYVKEVVPLEEDSTREFRLLAQERSARTDVVR
jgi:hypothetical protein